MSCVYFFPFPLCHRVRSPSFEVRALSCQTWAGEVECAVAEQRATSQLSEVAFIVSIEGLLIYQNLGRDAGSIERVANSISPRKWLPFWGVISSSFQRVFASLAAGGPALEWHCRAGGLDTAFRGHAGAWPARRLSLTKYCKN